MLPADLRVPAATLVETYSTRYLMRILSTNTHILLHVHNSARKRFTAGRKKWSSVFYFKYFPFGSLVTICIW